MWVRENWLAARGLWEPSAGPGRSPDESQGKVEMKTCLDQTGLQIVREVYRAIETLGGGSGLLACIAAWATRSTTWKSSR